MGKNLSILTAGVTFTSTLTIGSQGQKRLPAGDNTGTGLEGRILGGDGISRERTVRGRGQRRGVPGSMMDPVSEEGPWALLTASPCMGLALSLA